MRKSYSGAAASTTLTGGMLVGDTSAAVAATTNWPNAAVGPFVVVIDRGLSTEEKILVSAYTPTGFTVAASGRGYDGTTTVGHSNGATVNHCIDAVTINEANLFVNDVGSVTPSTSAVGDTAVDGTSTVAAAGDHKHAREPFATVTTNSAPGDVKNDGVSLSPARADHVHGRESLLTTWTAYVPVWTASATNPTIGNGTMNGRYLQIGKVCFIQIELAPGSTTSGGQGVHSFSLPFTSGANEQEVVAKLYQGQIGLSYAGIGLIPANGTLVKPYFLKSGVTNNVSQLQNSTVANGIADACPYTDGSHYPIAATGNLVINGHFETT